VLIVPFTAQMRRAASSAARRSGIAIMRLRTPWASSNQRRSTSAVRAKAPVRDS
jgi:hypothetical protein